MPESLMLTTTAELPVVISHACGREVCGNHVCCGNSGSLGVTAQRVLRSRDSSDGRARRQAAESCCTCDDGVNVLLICHCSGGREVKWTLKPIQRSRRYDPAMFGELVEAVL